MLEDQIIKLALILTPMYIANSCAMLFGGKTPLDLNIKIKGKAILGEGKTIKGTFGGIALGIIASFFIVYLYPRANGVFGIDYLIFGSVLSIGAIMGDLIGSLIKRRIGIKQGAPVFLLDQTDFVIGGLIFSSYFYVPSVLNIIIILGFTIVAHKTVNYLSYKLKIKSVPW